VPPETGLRVLVAGVDGLARAGLAALLRAETASTVAGPLPLDAALAGAVPLHRPDVVLADLGWEPALALADLAEAVDAGPPVLALVPADAGSAAAVRAAGAAGVLSRDSDGGLLAAALQAVASGLLVFDPALPDLEPVRVAEPPTEPLTARELDVLRLLAAGLPNKAIARRLGISEHTVKSHVVAVLGKLGAGTRTEAAMRAARLGLISL
jgi:DNA-binding NarL/FixJ family response regulator